MSSGAQQLIQDFEQVKKLLEIYPNIKIIKTEGDPPEQYDIEYAIKGYRTNPDGSAAPDNTHEVRITLPFGYPHFPPTVKPITPIFHPDIDPDAIRIADFWQGNNSLADLIVHIGQMICGNHYTAEEPFNQSAFDWFEERKSWLPFDILEPQEEDEITGDVQADPHPKIPSDATQVPSSAPAKDLDILKEDIDFPFDDDAEPLEAEDAFSFEFDEAAEVDDISETGEHEPFDEFSLDDFDLGEQSSVEPLKQEEAEETEDITSKESEEHYAETSTTETTDPDALQDALDVEIDDLFDLDSGTDHDEISFNLADEPEISAPADVEPAQADDQFDLASEDEIDLEDGGLLEFDTGMQDSAEQLHLQETEETEGILSKESPKTSKDHPAAETGETAELPAALDGEIDDLFSLDADDEAAELSFDLTDEPVTAGTEDAAPPSESGLFDLATENDVTETGEEPLEFDSDDISTAFEKEADTALSEPEAIDIELGDLPAQDEETDTFDFSLDDDSFDLGDEATADLSGLEPELTEEAIQDQEEHFEPDESAGDEEKILSALSLEEDLASEENPEEQADAIKTLIEQKQIFSAKKSLTELPESFPGRKELELTIDDAVSEAEDLFKKSDKHEQKGEFEKAGILLDLVANIAVDFPGLDFARNRIRESIMGGGKKQPDEKAPEEQTVEKTEEQEKETELKKPGTKKPRVGRSFKIPARLLFVLVAVILLAVIGAGGFYIYSNDSHNIHVAKTAFQKAVTLIKGKEFKNAQGELNTAQAALKKILVLHGTEKETLTSKIAEVTNSSSFQEGLKGRVLYGDKYVSVETAKAIDKFNTHRSYATQVLQAGKIEQAVEALEKSLPYAEKAGFTDQVIAINQEIGDLQLELILNKAKKSAAEKNWGESEEAYKVALEMSKSISSPDVQNEIAEQKALSSYKYGLHEGLKAINDSQWQRSIDAFQKVKKAIAGYPQIITDTEKTEIDKLLVQSRLYLRLSRAREAYDNKEWPLAINTYKDAIALLDSNLSLLGQEARDNIKKIERTILTTHVAREQVNVTAAKAENNLEKTVEYYENIITLIEKSEFKEGETLAQILNDAREKTVELKKELLISKREKWLIDNYEKIFRDNYPSARQSELLNPTTRFIKREGNFMLFNISCTEKKQGRSFRLELNYQYDLKKDSWKLFAGTIEGE